MRSEQHGGLLRIFLWAFWGAQLIGSMAYAEDTEAPTTPTGLKVTVGPNQLALAWNASTDNIAVTAYLIERCVVSACTYAQIASVPGTSYTDTDVIAGMDYSYRIRARDAIPNYSGYATVSASPAACD